jgi:DNA-binding NarL/FixJ family response regulator
MGPYPTNTVARDRHYADLVVECSDELSDRQRQVLELLSQGLSNKEIARSLGVTAKTVMHHTVAIYQKLGVRGRTEAIVWAYRAGVN